MAAKENISESHKRFLFFFLRLSSGCLSVTAWLAKRSWVGWQSHWCMALPRASGIPSPKTSSKLGPCHLSVSLPWGLAPFLAPHGWSHVHSTPWWRQETRTNGRSPCQWSALCPQPWHHFSDCQCLFILASVTL